MFISRDFLRGDYNVLSKNVTRDVRQSEKTLSEVVYNKSYCFNKMKNKQHHTVGPILKQTTPHCRTNSKTNNTTLSTNSKTKYQNRRKRQNIQVPVPSQESVWSCICVLRISIVPHLTSLTDLRIVLTALYIMFIKLQIDYIQEPSSLL
jgi:hypothetical protein